MKCSTYHSEQSSRPAVPAGLLQSLLVAVCLGLTMVLRLIPSAVLWGYFAFMALESLKGSQFWERLVYLATDPAKRYRCAP